MIVTTGLRIHAQGMVSVDDVSIQEIEGCFVDFQQLMHPAFMITNLAKPRKEFTH